MLGGFGVSYEGRPLALERSYASKATRLLQLLLFHAGEMVPREELIRSLFEGDRVADPINNLKVTLFRLRRLLSQSALPKGPHILFQEGGYRWNDALPVRLDIHTFAGKAQEALGCADARVKPVLLWEAAREYRGPLLPDLQRMGWVQAEGARLRTLYLRCVAEFCALQGVKDPEGCAALCDRAAASHPDDLALQALRLRMLLACRNYPKAIALYHEISARMLPKGPESRAALDGLYDRICGEAGSGEGPLQTLLQWTGAAEDGRPRRCSCLTLLEGLAAFRRPAEGPPVLLLYTLLDIKGAALARERLENAMSALERALSETLCGGDLYARCGASRFLAFRPGMTASEEPALSAAVETAFKNELHARGIRLLHDAFGDQPK